MQELEALRRQEDPNSVCLCACVGALGALQFQVASLFRVSFQGFMGPLLLACASYWSDFYFVSPLCAFMHLKGACLWRFMEQALHPLNLNPIHTYMYVCMHVCMYVCI